MMRIDGNTPVSHLYHSDMLSERTDVICHYGVKGMKWGVRRYQNKDGTRIKSSRSKTSTTRYSGSASSSSASVNRNIQNEIDTLKAETIANGKAAAGLALIGLAGVGANALMLSSGFINPTLVAATAVSIGTSAVKAAKAAIGGIKISSLKRQLKKGPTGTKEAKQDVKKTPESKAPKIDKVEANSFTDKFKTNRFGDYESRISTRVGNVDGVEISVRSSKGRESENSTAAANFLKRYNVDKAKNGIAKEYYDGEYSWIDKDPSSSNYHSRNDFKNKIKPTNIDIDPETRTYTVFWDDGGTYGGHTFVDEGSIDDMKVRYRSLEG